MPYGCGGETDESCSRAEFKYSDGVGCVLPSGVDGLGIFPSMEVVGQDVGTTPCSQGEVFGFHAFLFGDVNEEFGVGCGIVGDVEGTLEGAEFHAGNINVGECAMVGSPDLEYMILLRRRVGLVRPDDPTARVYSLTMVGEIVRQGVTRYRA